MTTIAFGGLPAPVPISLELGSALRLSDDELFELCQRNHALRIERTPAGDLIVMTPSGGETSRRNALVTAALTTWADADGTGAAFDSNCGFYLANGAMRSPDAAWVELPRLEAVPDRERERFLPLCPDFVIELLSPSDRLRDLTAKMAEYITHGARLGWLIDPFARRVHVYRPERAPQILDQPGAVSGDPELPGFVLSLEPIWAPR